MNYRISTVRAAARIFAASTALAFVTAPAFAQTVDAMTCADFATQDSTGQTQTIAAVQAFTSQQQAGQQLMSNEIFSQLTTNCAGHDDMMIMDALK